MPLWCPNCNAMLPEGTAVCPRCGTRLNAAQNGEEDAGREDVFWYSSYIIGVVLIPIIIAVVIGVICVLIFVLD
ncbi:MAG TPA: zinc-ribbon domain-containing protein [Anaerolineales bacterium]